MGAYLSKPVTEKVNEEGKNKYIAFGAASMQGWRYFQEDAHNCILDYDDNNSALFAVYDGHGGSEVAEYCAKMFPVFLHKVTSYVEGNMQQALEDSFLEFDATLVTEEVQSVLKQLAKGDESESGEDSDDDPNALAAEANQPLENVLEKYGGVESVASHLKVKLSKNKYNFESPCISAAGKKRRRCDDAEDHTVDGTSSSALASTDNLAAGSSSSVVSDQETEQAVCENENNENREKSTAAVGSSPTNGISSDTKTDDVIAEPEAKRGKIVKPEIANDEDEEDKDYKEGDALDDDEKDEASSDEEDDDDEEGEDEEADDDGDGEEEEESDDDEDEDEDGMLMDEKGEPGYDSGTTAVIALLRGQGELYVANAGDSRCVLCRSGKALDLSIDHKPEEAGETKRIVAAGGTVTADGRVNGGLNLSRAIGDHAYKRCENLSLKDQMITPLPDIVSEKLNPETDTFMILACDGIWNSLDSQEVVDFVSERLKKEMHVNDIIGELFDHCLAPDTSGDGTGCDNMTCIIIQFKDLVGLISSSKGSVRQSNSMRLKVTASGDALDS